MYIYICMCVYKYIYIYDNIYIYMVCFVFAVSGVFVYFSSVCLIHIVLISFLHFRILLVFSITSSNKSVLSVKYNIGVLHAYAPPK